MGIFSRKAPDYLVEIEPVRLKETEDMHATFDNYIDHYYKAYCNGKFLQRVFKQAHEEVKKMTDGELATSLRGGWNYDMLTIYLLKRVLVKMLPEAKSKDAKKSAYDLNKVLMSQAVNERLSDKRTARNDDADMRQRLEIDS